MPFSEKRRILPAEPEDFRIFTKDFRTAFKPTGGFPEFPEGGVYTVSIFLFAPYTCNILLAVNASIFPYIVAQNPKSRPSDKQLFALGTIGILILFCLHISYIDKFQSCLQRNFSCLDKRFKRGRRKIQYLVHREES